MSTETLDRLERIQYQPTAWEIVLVSPAGNRSYLIGYSARRTRGALLEFTMKFRERVREATRAEGFGDLRFWNRSGISLTRDEIPTGWNVRYSGRTKRESIISGELPWIMAMNPREIL